MRQSSAAKKEILFGIEPKRENARGARKTLHACEIACLREEGLLGSSFCLRDGTWFTIGLPGSHNVENALGAIAVAEDLGIEDMVIQRALRRARVPGRTETVDIGPGRIALVDYAHNGIALRHLLETLRMYEPTRLLLVFGCGGERDHKRRAEMGRVAAQMADYSVVTSDNPRREDPRGIIADIAEAMDAAGGAYEIIEDRGEAIRAAVRLTEAGDMLVVAGKGHETIQIIGNESRHFDDREELKKGRKL